VEGWKIFGGMPVEDRRDEEYGSPMYEMCEEVRE